MGTISTPERPLQGARGNGEVSGEPRYVPSPIEQPLPSGLYEGRRFRVWRNTWAGVLPDRIAHEGPDPRALGVLNEEGQRSCSFGRRGNTACGSKTRHPAGNCFCVPRQRRPQAWWLTTINDQVTPLGRAKPGTLSFRGLGLRFAREPRGFWYQPRQAPEKL
jgi:hypothetical protein